MKKILYSILTVLVCSSCTKSFNIQGSSNISMLDGRMLYLKVMKDGEMKKKLDGFITPERFERFIKENEGRKIAGRIIEKAKAPVQQQSAQRPQPAQTLAQPNPQRPGPAAKSK